MSLIGQTLTTEYQAAARREMRAINGKILQVDLTRGRLRVDEHDAAFYRTYVGGRGVVLHYLLSEMPASADPLGPDNLLVFAPGILTGTVMPGSGRHGVGAKSPLTGALASGEAGGWWGSELKRAGFDGIVIRGRVEQPVYLWVHDGQVEIRAAGDLWGKLTVDAADAIRAELGDAKIQVATIGPAGERLVRFAAIMHTPNRAAGRSGMGAVMGSKNLKAIAVRGSQPFGLADKNLMNQVVKWLNRSYRTSMGWAVENGTPGSVKFQHDIGSAPVRNFTEPVLEGIAEIDGRHIFELMLQERDTCNACPVRCKVVVDYDKDARYRIEGRFGGPEYESISALGTLCAVTDPVAVVKANELCAAYGLDTISTGGTIAFAMECAERGLLALPPDDDFAPRFGDGDSLVESVERIAARRGLGDRMAEGSARMAKAIGPAADDLVVTTRGQELPLHDPRLKNAFGLGYALSATGADHEHNMDDTFVNNPGSPNCARLASLGIPTPLPLFGLDPVKIQAFVYETAFMNFMDCAVICHFYPYEYQHLIDALNAATGWDVTREEIIAAGTRVVTMGRLFLLREGFTAQDDTLPARMFRPHAAGPIVGKAMTREMFREALQTYYRLMGWGEDGVPGGAALARLGLQPPSGPG